jgi:hypothetical protein
VLSYANSTDIYANQRAYRCHAASDKLAREQQQLHTSLTGRQELNALPRMVGRMAKQSATNLF